MTEDERNLLETLSQQQTFEQAHSLPAQAYQKGFMADVDRASVLHQSWQLIGHQNQFRETGTLLVHEVAGLPIVVVKTNDGIRAFDNVCRHRAGPLATENCQVKTLRCQYHGWNYGLDGCLKSAPEMQANPGFDVQNYRLPERKVGVWQGLVFVALDEQIPTLDELTAGIAACIQPIDFSHWSFQHRDEFIIDCNWKVYVENYLEGYHLPHVHPGLNRLLDYKSYQTELSGWHVYQHSPMDVSEGVYGAGQAHYFFIYPNTMLNILPNRLQTNQVLPLKNNQSRVIFDYYYPQLERLDELIKADQTFSDEVQNEDVGVCEAVQKGLDSGSYVPGPLCQKRESGVYHFQKMLRHAYRRFG